MIRHMDYSSNVPIIVSCSLAIPVDIAVLYDILSHVCLMVESHAKLAFCLCNLLTVLLHTGN